MVAYIPYFQRKGGLKEVARLAQQDGREGDDSGAHGQGAGPGGDFAVVWTGLFDRHIFRNHVLLQPG